MKVFIQLGLFLLAGVAQAFAQRQPVQPLLPAAAELVIGQGATNTAFQAEAERYPALGEAAKTVHSSASITAVNYVVAGAAVGAVALLLARSSFCSGAEECKPGTGTTVLIGAVGGGMVGGLVGMIVGGRGSRFR